MDRRLLIVVSSYAPAMTADMQRARQLAWELPALGWDVEILAPDSSYQAPACLDQDSDEFFAEQVEIHFVPAFLPDLFRLSGIGTIGWRALVPLLCRGVGLLRAKHYDLVYFSTTSFPIFLLGPIWEKLHGVPFVLDIQDPICREDTSQPEWAAPSVKHQLARRLANAIEAPCVKRAAGIVSVSQAYIDRLRSRYGSSGLRWTEAMSAAISFGALPRDLELVARRMPRPEPGGKARIVYVGAGGAVMRRSFGELCTVLSEVQRLRPALLDAVQIELHGTQSGWHDGDAKELADLAVQYGLAGLVREEPVRVSYRRSLELLLSGDGCLVLGVDDPAYMPSKLFAYLYSGKPLVACLRSEAEAIPACNGFELVVTLVFDDRGVVVPEAVAAVIRFLEQAVARRTEDRRARLERFLISTMARRHAELFTAVLSSASEPGKPGRGEWGRVADR